jgi:hypothetical protein
MSERKEVAPEIEQKVLKFAQDNEKFTTKQLFEAYPNNPESILRYALNNLRLDNKIHSYGSKRSTFYSVKADLPLEESALQAKEEGPDYEAEILKVIKEKKVVTTSQLVNELGFPSRVKVARALDGLIDQELVYTEGVKRCRKYIWHKVTPGEVVQVLADTAQENGRIESVDQLNRFLLNADEYPSIGITSNARGEITFRYKKLGSLIFQKEFANPKDFIKFIRDITEISDE